MRRSLLVFFGLFIVFLGALVAALALTNQRDFQLRGYVNPLETTELPYRVPLLGVNAELTQYTVEEIPAVLEQMQSAGVHWVRQYVYWDEIQSQEDSFDWSAWDTIIDATASSDLELVAVFMNTPEWAREAQNTNRTAPPAEPAQFAAFVGAFAARYGETVDHYQIWDEPNLTTAWGENEPKPAAYLALLSEVYTAIHDSDPDASVMAAALAPTTEDNALNISDLTYLNTLYELGAADFTDAIAAKPYGFDTSPDDRTIRADTLNFSRMVALREIMEQHDDAKTPLWASNWGWNSLPDTWEGSSSIWGSVTQDQQIQYTQDALTRAAREWPWVGGMILHHWQPSAPDDDPIWGFALVAQSGQPTPLLQRLTTAQQNRVMADGHYPPRTPFAAYSGLWTFSNIGADIGWQRDSRLTFTFQGTDVGLILRKGDYVGYLYPQIDAQPTNATPQDTSGNSYVILTSGSLQPEVQVVPIATTLSNEQHTLSAVADRGFDQYALLGYAVSRGDLAAPFNAQITLAGIIAVIAGIFMLNAGMRVQWRTVFAPTAAFIRGISLTGQIIISVVTSLALMMGMLLTFGDTLPALFRREPVHIGISILTAGILYLNPGLLLTLVSGVVLFVLIYKKITIGLMLTVFYAPFFLFPVALFSFAFPMAEILILLTFTAFVIRSLAEWGTSRQIGANQYAKLQLKLHPLDYAVIAWVILGVISITWAERTGLALTELRVMMIEPAMFYFVFRATKPDQQDRLRIVDALLLGGTIVALVGLYLFAQGQSIITAEGEARRLASVYGSPNNVALFLGRCIPFALAFFLRFTGIRKWAAVASGTVMLIAVLLTQSVGGIFIGIPTGIAAVLILVYGRRALLPLIAIAIIAVLGFGVLASQSERFARALDFTQGTNFYRIRVWESAFDMISDHPITGVGLDQFLYEFRGTYIRPDAWQEPDLSHPHNIILDFWTRLGFFGALLLLVMQYQCWKSIQQALKRLQNPVNTALIIGTAGSMANLLAHGFIDNSVYVNDLSVVFMLLLALSVTGAPEENDTKR